jgi:L-alanine-DL-glutamate epimerase-like enolase superfamily enzyme
MGRNGPVGFALSGIDIALWDIAGKQAGRPLHQQLGGGRRSRIPTYASLLRYGTPEFVARNAAAAAARGYAYVKLHEHTVETVAAARDAIGPGIALMLDTNCAWTPDEAIDMARRLEPYDLAWLEEPISPPDDYAALARLRRAATVPVAAGENAGNANDIKMMIGAGAVDVVQPSVTKIGGIGEMRRAIALAQAHGVRVAPHSPYFGPGLIAMLHVIATMDEDVACERFYCDLAASPLGAAIVAENGFMCVPDGPGLGVEIDERVIGRYRIG